MKAMEYARYGTPDVFQLNETAKPSPKADEVLVRVYATTVTAADIMMRTGKPLIGRLYLGVTKPKKKVLGFDFAGEVVETGTAVTAFKTGDRVFGGTTALGCYAEYLCIKAEDVITTIPEHISFEEAAPFSGSGITVWNFLKGKAGIKAGQKVLINGASGSLGTYAVQLAKQAGATVTAVCSTGNVEMVKALGADSVIDYTRQDFTAGTETYDIIFDTVGKSSFSKCKKILSEKGVYLSAVMSFSLFLQIMRTSFTGGKKAKSSATGMLPVKQRLAYLLELKKLLKDGQMRSVIGQRYTLAQMADAHRYVEKGHKKGNAVITI